VAESTWQFEYSVETDASLRFAWDYWTNVANWDDAGVEFEIDGPFAPGSRLTSKSPGQQAWHSVIRAVELESAASIELQLDDAVLRFDWRFDELSPRRTRITQRLTLEGENGPAYTDNVVIFESTAPDGMKRLARVLERAEAQSLEAALHKK